MSTKAKDWKRKNIKAMGRAPSARRSARKHFNLDGRKSEPSISEKQSAWTKRAKRQQPSMPKLNLPPVRAE